MQNWLIPAKKLPLSFAQVREDSLLDREIIEQLGKGINILMIGSGGCTAAFLATCPAIARMHIVDMHPAQIALCRLKMKLLQDYTTEERLAILGHRSMNIPLRKKVIMGTLASLGYKADILGPIEQVSRQGIDKMGRYEYLFAALRTRLAARLPSLSTMIKNNDAPSKEQKAVLYEAFTNVMTLPNLVALFGKEATQNALVPFAEHFYQQTIAIFRHPCLTNSANPYLQQMLLGRFEEGVCYPWIAQKQLTALPEIDYFHNNVNVLLCLEKSKERYHFIHLSNILDWLNEGEARSLLEQVTDKLNKDGCVFIRQLNSNLSINELCQRLEWDHAYGQKLLNRDRSFFYTRLYVGRKK